MSEESYIKIKRKALDVIREILVNITNEDIQPHNPNSLTKQCVEENFRMTINVIYSIKNDFRLNSTYIKSHDPIPSNSRVWNISENYYFPVIHEKKILHVFLEAYIE